MLFATTAHSLLSCIAFAQNVVPTIARETAMNTPTYDKCISALLVVDPYNDFISAARSGPASKLLLKQMTVFRTC